MENVNAATAMQNWTFIMNGILLTIKNMVLNILMYNFSITKVLELLRQSFVRSELLYTFTFTCTIINKRDIKVELFGFVFY